MDNSNAKMLKALIACWVKILADKTLKYFSYFSQKTDFDFFMQIVFKGDSLHEMSNPISGKIKKNINLLSAKLAQIVVKVKTRDWICMDV